MLSSIMVSKGFKLQTGGTDSHLFLWDATPLKNLDGSKLQVLLEAVGITLNKNSIVGDTSAVRPGGVRIGLAAVTTRGISGRENMEKLAWFLERATEIVVDGDEGWGGLEDNSEVQSLKSEVEAFVGLYPMPE